jgi:hypothetical protein
MPKQKILEATLPPPFFFFPKERKKKGGVFTLTAFYHTQKTPEKDSEHFPEITDADLPNREK